MYNFFRDCYPATLPLTSVNLQRHTYELLEPLARYGPATIVTIVSRHHRQHRQHHHHRHYRRHRHHHQYVTIVTIVNDVCIFAIIPRLLPNLERVSMANFERSESYLDGEDHLPILASFKRLIW